MKKISHKSLLLIFTFLLYSQYAFSKSIQELKETPASLFDVGIMKLQNSLENRVVLYDEGLISYKGVTHKATKPYVGFDEKEQRFIVSIDVEPPAEEWDSPVCLHFLKFARKLIGNYRANKTHDGFNLFYVRLGMDFLPHDATNKVRYETGRQLFEDATMYVSGAGCSGDLRKIKFNS